MYSQITVGERYTLGLLRRLGLRPADIARALGRHRSTIGRELARNTRPDGGYRPQLADSYARGRRSRSRRNQRFAAAAWAQVDARLREQWSPEQIAGRFRRAGQLRISHETIYRHIWADKRVGGTLYTHLRGAQKQCRKRYGQDDSRGRLAGKRPITARPAIVDARGRIGDWEVDTILGATSDTHCLLSLVERKTGYLVLGKLPARTTAEVNRRATPLIRAQRRRVHTITSDNGTEFHGYAAVEARTRVQFYFATPHHAWERGTNENTNGLVRQYAPKRRSMVSLTQRDGTTIARKLNQRPRKRLGYQTPEECYAL
ncbi:MAG: IS30 family transposase [Gemmatimonadota bacterium]|nr:IS30 family transposase [Gemmatimonadota bacterium]